MDAVLVGLVFLRNYRVFLKITQQIFKLTSLIRVSPVKVLILQINQAI
ncbi:hypothetical protein P353_22550 [Comamonas testosteroni]|uniref:Uncharacterized protein n=1 Tax=Comamonas testosteroni TaxID=285 RepID=A0A096F953_COMTE|nr:hypothetical protein P353_22550 [Comamonas testosteroni]